MFEKGDIKFDLYYWMFRVFTSTWHFSFTCNGHLHCLDFFVFWIVCQFVLGLLLCCFVWFVSFLRFCFGMVCYAVVWFGCLVVDVFGWLDAWMLDCLVFWRFGGSLFVCLFVCLFCLFVCVSVCRCLSVCFWFSISLYMGLSNLGGPKSILENSVAKRDLNSTDGLETTRIFEIGHLSSLLRPTFLLFINLPENVFFTKK